MEETAEEVTDEELAEEKRFRSKGKTGQKRKTRSYSNANRKKD